MHHLHNSFHMHWFNSNKVFPKSFINTHSFYSNLNYSVRFSYINACRFENLSKTELKNYTIRRMQKFFEQKKSLSFSSLNRQYSDINYSSDFRSAFLYVLNKHSPTKQQHQLLSFWKFPNYLGIPKSDREFMCLLMKVSQPSNNGKMWALRQILETKNWRGRICVCKKAAQFLCQYVTWKRNGLFFKQKSQL